MKYKIISVNPGKVSDVAPMIKRPLEVLGDGIKGVVKDYGVQCKAFVDASYPHPLPEIGPRIQFQSQESFFESVGNVHRMIRDTDAYKFLILHSEHLAEAPRFATLICNELIGILSGVNPYELLDISYSREKGYAGGYLGLFSAYINQIVLLAALHLIDSPGESRKSIGNKLDVFRKFLSEARKYCANTLQNDHCAYIVLAPCEQQIRRFRSERNMPPMPESDLSFEQRMELGTDLGQYIPPLNTFGAFSERTSAFMGGTKQRAKCLILATDLSLQIERIAKVVADSGAASTDVSRFKEISLRLNIENERHTLHSATRDLIQRIIDSAPEAHFFRSNTVPMRRNSGASRNPSQPLLRQDTRFDLGLPGISGAVSPAGNVDQNALPKSEQDDLPHQ